VELDKINSNKVVLDKINSNKVELDKINSNIVYKMESEKEALEDEAIKTEALTWVDTFDIEEALARDGIRDMWLNKWKYKEIELEESKYQYK